MSQDLVQMKNPRKAWVCTAHGESQTTGTLLAPVCWLTLGVSLAGQA